MFVGVGEGALGLLLSLPLCLADTFIHNNNVFTMISFQASGVGKLVPNMLIMGYMNNWQTRDPQEVNEYFDTIQ